MEYDTTTPIYTTADRTSFAYSSARERWPVILTGAIDDVHKAVSNAVDQSKRKEGKSIIAELTKLKYELQHDRALTDLADDGKSDITEYNKELKALSYPSWLNVSWLFSECYLYRRVATYFALSEKWKSHDVFARKKIHTFLSSRSAVVELASRYQELTSEIQKNNTKNKEEIDALKQNLFIEVCKICLWGNATDLSLLTVLSYEDIQKIQSSGTRKTSEERILIDDLASAYEVLKRAKKAGKLAKVDIVLDNAGFELYVDLILAGFLLSTGLANNIILHSKSIPWFVSDVVPADFGALLNILASPQTFDSVSEGEMFTRRNIEPLVPKELDALEFVFQQLTGFHNEGQIILRENRFWTEAGSFWRLPGTATQLYNDLKESDLVIFKGDLNYRKLTGDAKWDPTTPFTKSLGPMGQGSGVNILSLRTCKSDVIVGLKEGEDERLRSLEGCGDSETRTWAWTGKWAVMQFSHGKE